ncbi:MAG TPA: branched-chain amino acid ABC transporter substrate-binding protein [Burkholderiales bacterium]|nr:branched-chain amino acid ABC transporter substrate-binding protein [Burkholderiales bacterium]
MSTRFVRAALLAATCVLPFTAHSADTVRIAYIDPLSGAFANVGESGLHHFQLMAEEINAHGGLYQGSKLEIVPFDDKTSPQEALNQLKRVIDAGIRYISQGNGSSVAAALVDAVNRYNERNPGKEIVYLNYAAVDPVLTNEKCSFWHFRFDANSDMKMEALTNWMLPNKNIKKVYLINQDYSFGQSVAKMARELLAKKRPDVQIVGDDLHPLGQVKDFAPYVAKIKQSGADAVITGNWGNDITLLIKAAKDGGLTAPFFTYYGGGLGVMPALGDAAVGRVKQVTEYHTNIQPNKSLAFAEEYWKKFPAKGDDFYYLRVRTMLQMFAEATKKAKSVEPKAVAYALEGMNFASDTGGVVMRKDDHQLVQPLYLSTIYRVAAKGGPAEVKYGVEGTDYGFKTDARIEAKDTALPTTCKMARP